jgi:hypothetical protein
MRRLALSIVIAVTLPAAARAQACLGSVSFATAPVRFGGGAVFGDSFTAYAVSLIAGKENGIFGDVGVARIYDDDFDDTEDRVFVDAGYQRPVGARAQLCPMVGASLGTGPDDAGAEIRSRFASAGVALGLTFRPAPSAKVIPNGSLRFEYATSDVTRPSLGTETFTDNRGVAGLGLGLIFFNDRLAIQPTVQIPLAADDDEVTYGLIVSIGWAVRR